MRIAIEAQRIFRTNKHGMDFVALETIREIQQIDCVNEYYIIVSPGEDRCLHSSSNVHIVEVKCPSYPLWEQVALPKAVRKIKPDVLHCTSNTAPICCNVPLVLTLHDIIFFEKRAGGNKSLYQNLGWYYRKFVVPRIIDKCRKIITVSHFEKERIQAALNLPQGRIVAIHNGYSSHFKPLTSAYMVSSKYYKGKDYLFFLGNTDPKKNTLNTLKGYAFYVERSSDPKRLLIADLKPQIIKDLLDKNGLNHIAPYIHALNYVPNSDLPSLLNESFAFLYTSLRESFGIPILEAMACGCPIITSNTSAIPEVAGEGALLVDPTDHEAIGNAILRLETDPLFRKQQSEYGLSRVQAFSWKATAQSLVELYQSVGQHG